MRDPAEGRTCPLGECDGSTFIVDPEARTTRACRCRPQRIAEAKAHRLSAVLPKKYRGVGFDRFPVTEIDPHIVDTVRRYVRNLDDNLDRGRGLWFVGDVGTGKTTLAMLISKHVLESRRTAAIYSLPKLLYELRKTYDANSELSYLGLIDLLTSVDLLHIDDLGSESSSEWVLEQLYTIVNSRYEEEKAIILTTNVRPEDLADQITERTVSRLKEMCGDPLPLFGTDRRGEVEIPEHLRAPAAGAPLRYGELPS